MFYTYNHPITFIQNIRRGLSPYYYEHRVAETALQQSVDGCAYEGDGSLRDKVRSSILGQCSSCRQKFQFSLIPANECSLHQSKKSDPHRLFKNTAQELFLTIKYLDQKRSRKSIKVDYD